MKNHTHIIILSSSVHISDKQYVNNLDYVKCLFYLFYLNKLV